MARATDTTIVVNNAGSFRADDSITGGDLEDIRSMFETNFFGAANISTAFGCGFTPMKYCAPSVCAQRAWLSGEPSAEDVRRRKLQSTAERRIIRWQPQWNLKQEPVWP